MLSSMESKASEIPIGHQNPGAFLLLGVSLTRFSPSETCRRFSLMVMRIPTLASLGLRSLREISDGSVYISQNARLCYHHTVNWTQLFRGRRVRANSLSNNRPPAECGKAAGKTEPPLTRGFTSGGKKNIPPALKHET